MGFGLDQRFWAAQIPAVTATHSFVTFDNRGVGRSDGEQISTIEDMAGDAIALLDHLDIGGAVLFGLSMGGAIAQTIALDHPERVSALVLACTWARPIEFMRRQSALAELVINAGGPAALVDSTLVRMFTPKFFEVGGEFIDRMVAALLAEGGPELGRPEILLAQLGAVDKHDVLSRLGDIRVPTLVLGGKVDMMVPYFAQEEIAGAIPGAELATFETGHGCMIEEMDAFNARVSEFLGGLET
jgi:pimeloyl-ACP methyl ester carboxylesterase